MCFWVSHNLPGNRLTFRFQDGVTIHSKVKNSPVFTGREAGSVEHVSLGDG
jgi:hypothetical protein